MAERPPRYAGIGENAPLPLLRGHRTWAEFVGNRVRDLRELAALTQTQLAREAGMLQSHISRVENAEGNVSDRALRKIARALSVRIEQIDPCAGTGCPMG